MDEFARYIASFAIGLVVGECFRVMINLIVRLRHGRA